jgi:hypothetical protein
MDMKMEKLLQSERQKKHLSNDRMASMHLKKLSKAEKSNALRLVLKEQRKWHVKNIEDMKNQLLVERKKRALSKYDTTDVKQTLNLSSMMGKVEKPEEDPDTFDDDIPLFLFWTSWGTKSEVRRGADGLFVRPVTNLLRSQLTKYIDKVYHSKYAELHGDPILTWKKKMSEEAAKRQKNKPHGEGGKKAKRRFGVAVMGIDLGIR